MRSTTTIPRPATERVRPRPLRPARGEEAAARRRRQHQRTTALAVADEPHEQARTVPRWHGLFGRVHGDIFQLER